jgi:hypothetical protein
LKDWIIGSRSLKIWGFWSKNDTLVVLKIFGSKAALLEVGSNITLWESGKKHPLSHPV